MRNWRSLELKNLAEAVIMQAIEDLWDKEHRRQSLDFFSGERFRDCAELAEMNIHEQLTLLKILRASVKITSGVRGLYKGQWGRALSLEPED
jgi:hypothetical protein